MENLDKIFTELVEILKTKNIISKNTEINRNFLQRVEHLRDALKEKFPNTKLPRMMKSIHYANYFQYENLKSSAFFLDDVEQYLCLNGWTNHDENVDFVNNKIIPENFVPPTSMVATAIESLIVGLKNQRQCLKT